MTNTAYTTRRMLNASNTAYTTYSMARRTHTHRVINILARTLSACAFVLLLGACLGVVILIRALVLTLAALAA